MATPPRLDDLQRLAVLHGLSAAADAFFTVSLADSLFFNISVEAARPRLLLYLAITMAPFAVLAPLIGPFIDRVRGGQRTVLVATAIGRAALMLALVQDLRSLLMFPEAFGVLVLGKTYSIARSATVPRLVQDEGKLVTANAFLARVGLIASSVGGGIAALILGTIGPALALYLAAGLLLLAATTALTINSPKPAPHDKTRLEYHELHAVRLTRAVQAVGLLRASVGMLTFLLGFALKRSGAPVWHFGLVLVAGGIGAIAATALSGPMRERFGGERVLVLVLAMPSVVAFIGVLQFSIVTAVMGSAALGLAASTGKHVFDSFVQRSAPDANMARAFAGFETRFQLSWIAGSTLAVLTQADPRLGLLLMSLVLAGGAITIEIALHDSDRFEASPNLMAAISQLVLEDAQEDSPTAAVLDAADIAMKGGATRASIIVAAAALEAHLERGAIHRHASCADLNRASAQLIAMRDAVIRDCPVSNRDVERALSAARHALESEQHQTERADGTL